MLPLGSCNRKRVSVYADAGFEATGPEVVARGAADFGAAGGARPSRSAFSFSVLNRRSSLSAAIFALILSLAAISSCFSLRFAAASLSCSFFFRSSLISCVSLVLFRRISYDPSQLALSTQIQQCLASFFFLSNLSCSDVPDRFSASFLLNSSSLAFFSSSVRGAISSVDSEKSTWPVLVA